MIATKTVGDTELQALANFYRGEAIRQCSDLIGSLQRQLTALQSGRADVATNMILSYEYLATVEKMNLTERLVGYAHAYNKTGQGVRHD